MITIVEPKEHIDKLWGKQKIREGETYRLMRYLLRVDHEDKVLLHNVVTGHLVVLEREEAEALANLPAAYSPVMEQLVTEHYLVSENYDEFQQVQNLKQILRKLDEVHEPKGFINHYTILPTTACNARCYYCFEQGVKPVTMTEQTADDVVAFIKTHCGGQKVLLSWFGGEPTLAVERIDQICRGLQAGGVDYWSEITTNGYLFDEESVKKAKELWKLNSAMICVDGTEENYNRTKCFVYKDSNPYQIVMRNIGLLLAQNILVHLRMNFDVGNYGDFADLVNEAKERFKGFSKLCITAHPVIGEHRDYTGNVNHGTYSWFESKALELNNIADEENLQHRDKSLPCLKHQPCMAACESSVVITAEGKLASCPEQFGKEQWKGNLKHGVTNAKIVAKWKEMAVFEKCKDCSSFPHCVSLLHCNAAGNCSARMGIVQGQKLAMKQSYERFASIR